MRTYEQLNIQHQEQAKLLALDYLLTLWVRDPFDVFPEGSEGGNRLSDLIDDFLDPADLRDAIMADPYLSDWIEAEAIELAQESYYPGIGEAVESAHLIDLSTSNLYKVESLS